MSNEGNKVKNDNEVIEESVEVADGVETGSIELQRVDEGKTKEDNSKNKLIIILILIILLMLLFNVFAIGSLHKHKFFEKWFGGGDESSTQQTQQFASSGEIVPGEIDVMTQEELQQKVNETVAKGMFQVFMNTRIKVADDGLMNIMIQNNKSNHYDCYVVICKGDEEIYKSGVLAPSYKLEADYLTYDLEDGEHDCVGYFCVLNENGEEINRVGLEITLVKGVQ